MQPRFDKRSGNAPYSLVEQPRFRAGFDFLRLRGQIGEIDPALAEWWEKFSTAYDDERHEMVEALRQSQQKKPQAPRVRVKRPAATADDVSGVEDAAQAGALPSASPAGLEGVEPAWQEGDAAPAKKRRRRRKPTNRGAAGTGEGGEGGGEASLSSGPSASSESGN